MYAVYGWRRQRKNIQTVWLYIAVEEHDSIRASQGDRRQKTREKHDRSCANRRRGTMKKKKDMDESFFF